MMYLKQLFCRHLYQDIKETYLSKSYFTSYLTSTRYQINKYAIEQKCIKCDKTRLIERCDDEPIRSNNNEV